MTSLSLAETQLAQLSGRWAGEETLFASPWTAESTAHGEHHFTSVLGGKGLQQTYTERRADGSLFELYGFFAVDPDSQDVVWYTFDSYVALPESPAQGRWEGNVLTLIKRTARGEARHQLTLKAEELAYSIETRLIGSETAEFQPVMQGHYRRVL